METMAAARSSREGMVFDDVVEAAPGDNGRGQWRHCWLLFLNAQRALDAGGSDGGLREGSDELVVPDTPQRHSPSLLSTSSTFFLRFWGRHMGDWGFGKMKGGERVFEM